ncbi:MAG: ABC transporter ATP-binding protein [Bacteroidales bacterium]|nr:ABC transporter ATP-binding protein [Bacteroidales bacterium]HOI32926.1 ABC transporter ATP-binding protein [Bacteroidales bacterium]
MLEIKGLHKKLGSFELQAVDLSIKHGDYCVLLGPSGSGKSLLLELICGFQEADQGEMWLDGRNITKLAVQQRKASMVFQKPVLFPHLSVKANIAFALRINRKSKQKINKQVNALASQFQLTQLLNRKPGQLSGGEAQRVMLARALASEPSLLLLDEPLSSLDVLLRQDLRKLLKELNKQGTTILHVTHDYEEAMRMAKTIGIMQAGHLIQWGNPSEVFKNPTSAFAAELSGLKNFFEAKLLPETENGLRKVLVRGVLLFTQSKLDAGIGKLVIDEKQIVLSKEAPRTSAQNCLKGFVKQLQKTPIGIEIEIDCGIFLIAYLTEFDFEQLALTIESEVYVSFKTSAVRFFTT